MTEDAWNMTLADVVIKSTKRELGNSVLWQIKQAMCGQCGESKKKGGR
jgi:hypothetical protein